MASRFLPVLTQAPPSRSPLRAREHTITLGHTRVMGILNVTPDSFSDGGLHLDPAQAVRRGVELLDQGADILDIGGVSTRPGASTVAASEERARVLPVIEGLRRARPGACLSLDTTSPEVAAEALERGVHLLNDVRGLADGPDLAKLAARAGAALVIMHSSATPDRMQDQTSYGSFPGEIIETLARRVERARGAGLASDQIVVDPGFGFGKTWPQNVTLLRELGAFHALGQPLLVGLSRKSFLGWLTGEPRASARDVATHAAGLFARCAGAHILRVHDVAGARASLAVAEAVLAGRLPEEASA